MGREAREKRQQEIQQEHAELVEQLTSIRQRLDREIVATLESFHALASECRAGRVPSTQDLDIIIEHCDRRLSARRAETE